VALRRLCYADVERRGSNGVWRLAHGQREDGEGEAGLAIDRDTWCGEGRGSSRQQDPAAMEPGRVAQTGAHTHGGKQWRAPAGRERRIVGRPGEK
jgi:hypothetical protein